jgi:hypothetical protein
MRQERLTTVTRLLFPSHEIAAIEWLFTIRALRSFAAARFHCSAAEALRWLEPALAELTPAVLLFVIRTRLPLEVTPATTLLADRITAVKDHLFPGSSEYNAYLWLNDVAKLAELARLVPKGDLPATFAWITPAIELATELWSAAHWKDDNDAWRDESRAWQHTHYVDHLSQAPFPPIIIQPSPPSISRLGYGLRVRHPSPSPPRSQSPDRGHRSSCTRSLSPTVVSPVPTWIRTSMTPHPTLIQEPPQNIYTRGHSRSVSRGSSRSSSRNYPPRIVIMQRVPSGFSSRSSSGCPRWHHNRFHDPPPPTIIMHTSPSSRRSRSRSPPGSQYSECGRRTHEPTTIVLPERGRSGSTRGRSPTRCMDNPRSPSRVILTQPSTHRSRSRSRVRSRLHKPHPPMVVQVERSRSRSRSRCRARSSRSYSPPRVVIPVRTHTQRSCSRQRAAPELPLADDGRPDMITATVKSAAVRGKPARPKRSRTVLASLAGE